MKKLIPVILASLVVCSCASQKNTRLYAYRQAMLGGPAPQVITDEKGNQRQVPAPERVTIFIYLESPASNVQAKEIWIKKKVYSVKETIVVATPVVMANTSLPLNKPDTLVRATRNKVLQLVIGPEMKAPGVSASTQKKIKGNEIVVRCMVNGKEQYFSAASIKNLAPVALQ